MLKVTLGIGRLLLYQIVRGIRSNWSCHWLDVSKCLHLELFQRIGLLFMQLILSTVYLLLSLGRVRVLSKRCDTLVRLDLPQRLVFLLCRIRLFNGLL